ncbi:AK17B protein, partial [Centropus bengalensis]|nr:AK17B protein [Centropus bengalensis]
HREGKHKEELKCPLSQKGASSHSEEGDGSKFHASACPIVRTIVNGPCPAPSWDKPRGQDASSSSGWGSLLITVTQDCRVIEALGAGDCPALHGGHRQAGADADSWKKQKVYETDEFIHYLLNYYQTPHYARACFEPDPTVNQCWWKRVVADGESGFDVRLSDERGQHSREMSPLENLDARNCGSDGDYRLVVTVGELDSADVALENKTRGSGFAKVLRNDALTAGNSPHAGLSHSWGCSAVTWDEESKEERGSHEGIVPDNTCGSASRLNNFLGEISDSKCFREERSDSVKRTGRRCEEIYSDWNKGWLPAGDGERKLLVYLENVTLEGKEEDGSRCSFCSNSVHEGLARQQEHRLKKSCKRSSSKLRHEGQRSERQSREEEGNACTMKKKRKKLSSTLVSDDCGSSGTDTCTQLESLRKIQSKCKKMFHKKVKFKTLHTSVAAAGATPRDGSQLQESLRRTGEERKLMLRREMDADIRGCPLFPLEIIQTNPCSDTFCGAEPRRGC